MTISEYLDFEAAAEEKHEYVDGEILAMSGGSASASRMAASLIAAVHDALRGKPCDVYDSNLKVRIGRKHRYRYPDAMVICGSEQFDPDDKRRHTITNPRVIFEILSPSTERSDRTTKFDDYRSIDGVEEYVLLSQSTPRVETYHRKPDGTWQFDVKVGLDSAVTLKSIGIDLPLSELYAGVELSPEEDADERREA